MVWLINDYIPAKWCAIAHPHLVSQTQGWRKVQAIDIFPWVDVRTTTWMTLSAHKIIRTWHLILLNIYQKVYLLCEKINYVSATAPAARQ